MVFGLSKMCYKKKKLESNIFKSTLFYELADNLPVAVHLDDITHP